METSSSSEHAESPECGKCDGSGWVQFLDEQNRLYRKPCECRIEKSIRFRVPELFWDARLDRFEPETSQFVRDWLEYAVRAIKEKRNIRHVAGLFLYGPTGNGKTYLSAAIFRYVKMRGLIDIQWHEAAALLASMRDAIDHEGKSEREVFSDYIEPPLLILNDLGTGSFSEAERRYLYIVLDRRLNACRPTIVTTNWSVAELKDRYDERISSRLSAYKPLLFEGEDLRVRLQEQPEFPEVASAPDEGPSPEPYDPKQDPEMQAKLRELQKTYDAGASRPTIDEHLLPPATDEEIRAAERRRKEMLAALKDKEKAS